MGEVRESVIGEQMDVEAVHATDSSRQSVLSRAMKTIAFITALFVEMADQARLSSAQEPPGKPQPEQLAVPPRPVETKDASAMINAWFAKWCKESKINDLQAEVDRLVADMDSPKFMVREKATGDLMRLITNLEKKVNPPPFDIEARIGELKKRGLSPEQNRRVAQIQDTARFQRTEQPTRLPSIKGDPKALVDILAQQSRSRVRLDESDTALMQVIEKKSLTIDAERNSFWEIVDQVCRETGAHICLSDKHEIVISTKGKPMKLLDVQGYTGVFLLAPEKAGEPPTVVLASEPGRGSLVHIQSADIQSGPSRLPVKAWPEKPDRSYTGNNLGRPLKHKEVVRAGDKPKGGDGMMEVKTAEATMPIVGTLQFAGDHEARCMKSNNHSVRIEELTEGEKGVWNVKLNHTIWMHIAWPDTPWTWDTGTYGTVIATQCEFFDEKGQLIPSTFGTVTDNQREATSTWQCQRRPAYVRVRAYTDLRDREFKVRVPANELPKEKPGPNNFDTSMLRPYRLPRMPVAA